MIRNRIYTALFAALMAICAWIAIPVPPVAFTLQTFGALLALGTLGGTRGTLAIGLYLALGLVGLPVFSGFQGGAAVLAGPTGGFLWGFLAGGLVYRVGEKLGKLPAMVLCQLICYLCGCLWFSRWAGCSLSTAALTCVAPYLLPDGGKLWLAWHLSNRLKRFGI